MLELSMADKLRRTQFLGREFLTWLMFRATRDDGVFRDDDGGVVEVFFERALTLDGENPAREMSTIKVDEPARSEEVMLSLRLGKKVSRARLTLVSEGREYALVLDASALTMRSVKLPDAPAMDPIENMVEKTEYCRDLEDVVHRLFVRYVRTRLDPDAWADEAAAIAAWLAGTPPVGEVVE
jgi:hypothetical protein